MLCQGLINIYIAPVPFIPRYASIPIIQIPTKNNIDIIMQPRLLSILYQPRNDNLAGLNHNKLDTETYYLNSI